jgi:hypothetical protein
VTGGGRDRDAEPELPGAPSALDAEMSGVVVRRPEPAAPGGPKCRNHPELRPRFVCRACSAAVCAGCARMVRGIPLCPFCGQFCSRFDDVERAEARAADRRSGFGFGDIAASALFPWTDPARFVVATVWVLCAAYVAIAAALFLALPFMYAPDRPALLVPPLALLLAPVALQFTYMAHVIRSAAEGDLDDLAPDLTESLATGLVGAAWLVAVAAAVSLGPATLVGYAAIANGPSSRVATFAAVAWAVAYAPAATMVAGYTRSAAATANPFMGLSTVRRMGGCYAAAAVTAVMLFAIEVGAIGATAVAVVRSGLVALPPVGGLVLALPVAIPGFYLNLVIAGVLGRALYKSGSRLAIPLARSQS